MHERSEQVARIFFFVAGGLAGAGAALLLALFALAVSVFLQVRAGRRSTRDVIQDVDHESPPAPARALSGTIELRPRRVR